MNEIATPARPATLQDVHRAIEALAINQAEIGLGVLALLHAKLPEDEQFRTLYDRIDASINELQALAQLFLDKPL